MNAEHCIRELSLALRLADAPQDWGIENADPARIEESLAFCDASSLDPIQRRAMGELILASRNDALDRGDDEAVVADAFGRVLSLRLMGTNDQVEYWSSLPNVEEFPIGDLLRRTATHT